MLSSRIQPLCLYFRISQAGHPVEFKGAVTGSKTPKRDIIMSLSEVEKDKLEEKTGWRLDYKNRRTYFMEAQKN